MAWKKILLIISTVVTAVAVAFYILLILAFNGGLSGVISKLIPEPNWSNSAIIAAKDNKQNQINQTFRNIESESDLTSVGSFTSNTCSKGDHDWKRNDSYAYSCGLTITHFYSFSNNFRNQLVKLDSVLTDNGFTPEWRSMSYMLSGYYDNLTDSNYGRTRMVSSLPEMSYVDQNHSVHISMDFAQRGTPKSDLDLMQYSIERHYYNEVYSQYSPIKLIDVFNREMVKNQYFIMISINRNYYSI